ncbi:MAG: peptidoglycan-binding protein [Patescibacteria group bacterium]
MPKKIKLFLNSEQKVSKLIFGVLMVGLAVLVAGNGAFAYFQRTASDSNFEYGYGYGGSGYGYGYGYGADVSGYNDYGFEGADGKATALSAAQSGSTRLVVSYTTDYYAKNKVYYSATSAACSSLTSSVSQTAFQTGVNSATISDLTCGTTHYYCVASEDAGGNIWYTSVASAATGACGGGGTGGGSVAPIVPATTTVATTTVATTTVATTTVTTGTTTVTKPISQMTVTELRSKIKEITNLLIGLLTQMIGQWQLQLQVALNLQGQSVPAVLKTLDINLKHGNMGDAVKLLQTWLSQDKEIYPLGIVNGIFGPATKAAVIKFQEKYKAEILTPIGLTAGNGLVGAATRAKLNSLYGGQ